jgi:hypothetical protein
MQGLDRMPSIIGGEFAIEPGVIDPSSRMSFEADEYVYSTGRSALYYILINIKINYPQINTLLIPNYLCHSIIEIIEYADFRYILYEIGLALIPDINQLYELSGYSTGLLFINFFGLTNIETVITNMRKMIPDACIILDNVQSLFEMRKHTEANYVFTSLRKWLPVPDGAVVKTKEKGMNLPDIDNAFSQLKFAASLLKAYNYFPEIKDKMYLDLFLKGEEILNKNYNCKCSTISLSILGQIDYIHIINVRRNNAKFLISELEDIDDLYMVINSDSMGKEMVPMFLPVFSENRDLIKEQLFKNNIFCPIHWPVPRQLRCNISQIYAKELSLVIDQRYSIQDMERIVKILKTNI